MNIKRLANINIRILVSIPGRLKMNKPYKIDYSDEVTAEQVARIQENVKLEFETGTWVTVEDDTGNLIIKD